MIIIIIITMNQTDIETIAWFAVFCLFVIILAALFYGSIIAMIAIAIKWVITII